LTPYYKEDVLFSSQNLEEPNEDGVSILFYLQKIYPGYSRPPKILLELTYHAFYLFLISIKPDLISWKCMNPEDEWKNFLERVDCKTEEEVREDETLEDELRLWASYRGQTLTRTGILLHPSMPALCVMLSGPVSKIVVSSCLNSKRDDVLSKSFGASGFS
jgi:callose synthase